MEKKCGKCKVMKPLRQFAKNRSRKSGFHNECLHCQSEYNRIWFAQKNYGLSKEQAVKIIEKVRSGEAICEICQEALELKKNGYAIDHNHSTGQVRGLLCSECNKGIGHLKEDLYIVSRITKYLEKYRS